MALPLPLVVVAFLVGGVSSQREARSWPKPGDGPDFQWTEWESWICMCDIGKQGRIRYFIMSTDAEKSNVSLDDFWQVKPCSLADCTKCQATECPVSESEVQVAPRFGHHFSRPAADTLQVLNAKPAAADSYDSLPVIDDVG